MDRNPSNKRGGYRGKPMHSRVPQHEPFPCKRANYCKLTFLSDFAPVIIQDEYEGSCEAFYAGCCIPSLYISYHVNLYL